MKHGITIGWKEFCDRLSNGWVVCCALVWLGAVALTSIFGMIQIGRIGLQGYERTVMSMLNLIQYLVPLLALLLGHDLIVSEREERTLTLMVASGVSSREIILGKFIGAALVLALPLMLGFSISGAVIGFGVGVEGLMIFLKLALSGLMLGIIFLGIGLLISILCRTRVQALVGALLTWCVAVFVFDLLALGLMLGLNSNKAAHEIEFTCEATHMNSAADIHQQYDNSLDAPTQHASRKLEPFASWILINPVDLFRAFNLADANSKPPTGPAILSMGAWLVSSLGIGIRRLRHLDL